MTVVGLLLYGGLSLVVVSREYPSVWCAGSSGCSMPALRLRLPGSGAQAQELWCPAELLLGLWVGSSWARSHTHVPCIARWILNHWPSTLGSPTTLVFILVL